MTFTKFLGVIIDVPVCLSSKEHITTVENKIAKTVGLMYQRNVKSEDLNMLYASLLLPYLLYCIPLRGNTTNLDYQN